MFSRANMIASAAETRFVKDIFCFKTLNQYCTGPNSSTTGMLTAYLFLFRRYRQQISKWRRLGTFIILGTLTKSALPSIIIKVPNIKRSKQEVAFHEWTV